MAFRDDAATLAFAVSEATRIENEVYRVEYSDIRYPTIIPVDTTGPEWAASVTYFSMDRVGRAQWFNSSAHDVPKVGLTRTKQEVGISLAAIGYEWNVEELARAQQLGINLPNEKAIAARRTAEEFIDNVAFFGDAAVGYTGIANNATVTVVTAAATGTGSATTFASKTAANIRADVNTLLSAIWTGTTQVEFANTLLLPGTQFADLATRTMTDQDTRSILEWLRVNNISTQRTGVPLRIEPIVGLETAGASTTARMIAYRNDPMVLKLYMPMPFRFEPVMRTGPLVYEVPGIFRLGGVDVKRPRAVRYMDGI